MLYYLGSRVLDEDTTERTCACNLGDAWDMQKSIVLHMLVEASDTAA